MPQQLAHLRQRRPGPQHRGGQRVTQLVRTDPGAKKHDGVSFILMDMRQPGVEPRPILMIGGASPFCEVFFTDVRAAKDDLLGELNGGWSVGKRLLQHERASQTGAPGGGGRTVPLQDIAKKYLSVDEKGRLEEIRGILDRHGFRIAVERDPLLKGTPLVTVFASRRR